MKNFIEYLTEQKDRYVIYWSFDRNTDPHDWVVFKTAAWTEEDALYYFHKEINNPSVIIHKVELLEFDNYKN